MGTKRASPGDNHAKAPIAPEQLQQLEALKKDFVRHQLKSELQQLRDITAHYEKRREHLKKIPQFWFGALSNDPMFAMQWLNLEGDVEALKHLEDVWVTRHESDPRAFTLELHFKENPYFSNTVLTKEYKLKNPWSGPQTDGIYDEMLETPWDPETVLKPSIIKIDWKSEFKNLTKLHPRKDIDEAQDEFDPEDFGSFFNLFEIAQDPFNLGPSFADEYFPNAILHFLGEAEGDDDEVDSESEESGDSDEEEIDLERPKKRARKA